MAATGTQARSRTDSFHQGFSAFVHRLHAALPTPVRSRVPITFVAFALINGFTFSVDLTLLAVLYDGLGVWNPVAVTTGYAVAFGLAFWLNRWLNFDVHGDVGRQAARYVPVLAVNYLGIILAVGSGLTFLGVPFWVARLLAGALEAVWMYSALRWFVFRGRARA